MKELLYREFRLSAAVMLAGNTLGFPACGGLNPRVVSVT